MGTVRTSNLTNLYRYSDKRESAHRYTATVRYHRHMVQSYTSSALPDATEALSRVEILYTDLDGTLLAPGGRVLADAEGAPSTRTAEAIVELNKANLTVVPISGRTVQQLTELARLLGWSGFIAEVGSVSVHNVATRDVQVTYHTGEWPEGLLSNGQTPYDLIRNTGALAALHEAFPGRVEYHTPWHRHREGTHLLRGCLDLAEAQAVLDQFNLPMTILDNGQVHPRTHGLCCLNPIHAYHLAAKGVSKAAAIEADLAARGLKREQAAAIGDSLTDLEMSSAVGVMALVANALESPSVDAALATGAYPDVLVTCCKRGDGWSEFAHAWLAARRKGRSQ